MQVESIAKSLGGNKARRTGTGWLTCCPAHDDKNPSLSIWLDSKGKLGLKCYSGCSYKSIISTIKLRGFDTKQKAVHSDNLTGDIAKKDWSDKAQYIWDKAISIYNTPAEKYLQFRGCIVPECEDIRYLPAYKEKPHAMVARITDVITGKPLSLHFTYLKPDGFGKADIEKQRSLLFGHRKKGGVIRLYPDEDVTIGLGIAEGIETALSVAKYWQPVWSTIDASNMDTFPVLEGIESLTIFPDPEPTGMKAAEKCANLWKSEGRSARIVPPTKDKKSDWNDVAGRVVA